VSRPTIARLRSGTAVAGWLCKANPEVWDVESHLAAHGRVDRWRLMHGYRAELLAPGHPFVLWLTGPRSGVIAVGFVTGRAEIADDGDAGPRPYCPIDAVAIDPIRKATLLADLGFELAEVVRTPRAGNPLALTPDELDMVADHLEHDPWPRVH
jgi:hypothetical protein